jgi:saccharopine dehydrogenase-like NADP-dependent oxidoreductase
VTDKLDQDEPLTDIDDVVVYVRAVGTLRGHVQHRSFVKKLRGARVNKVALSAIQLTTAAGVLAVLDLFAAGRLQSGFVKQESVSMADFLATRWGGEVYGGEG